MRSEKVKYFQSPIPNPQSHYRFFASLLRIVWAVSVIAFFSLNFSGCEKKDWHKPDTIHWDRDMCERCKMAISERKYAVEVIDPKTRKHYKFDDIGCAILWFKENQVPWEDRAIIWVKDGKTGQWIDARKAVYTTDKLTPMGYGFTAYADKQEAGKGEVVDYDEVKRRVIKIGR